MLKPPSLSARTALARTAAVLLAAVASIAPTAAFVALAAPAHAADLGTLTLNPTSGTVDANPMLTGATSSKACPAGYGTNATLKVGKVGGPYNNLNRVFSAGGYDTAPFTLEANRSLTTSNGGVAPANGDYLVVVVCTSETQGDHPNMFATTISVTGNTWQVKAGGPAPTTPTTAPATGPTQGQTIVASIAPGTGTTTPTSTAPTTPAGSLPITGTSLALMIATGAGLVGIGWAAVRAARRRRQAAG